MARACCAPLPPISAISSRLMWPNTWGLRYSLPSWCTIGGPPNSASMLSVMAALGADFICSSASFGAVPMTIGTRAEVI